MKVTEVNEKGKPETSLSPSSMEKREHRKRARIRRAQIAIAALLIFVLSSLMALNMTEQNTLAVAHPLETIQHFLRGDGEIPAPSSGGREDKRQTVRITDPESIDEALRLMPQLYIPEYVPEGWEMKSLEVAKKTDGSCFAKFIFQNTSLEKMLIQEVSGTNMESGFTNFTEKKTINGKDLYFYDGDVTDGRVVYFYEKEVRIQINGLLQRKELIEVAGQMKQNQADLEE